MKPRVYMALTFVAVTVIGATTLLFQRADDIAQSLLNRAAERAGLSVRTAGPARLGLLPPALRLEGLEISRNQEVVAQIRRASAMLNGADLLIGRFTPIGISMDDVATPKARFVLDHVDLRFTPDRVEGSVKSGGTTAIVAGSRNEDGTELRLTIPGAGASLRFLGEIETDRLGGHVWFTPGKAEQWTGLNIPVLRAEADVEMGGEEILIANFQAFADGGRADGAASILLGSPLMIEADLSLDRLNLDSWRLEPATLIGLGWAGPPASTPATAPATAPAPITPASAAPLQLPEDAVVNLVLRIDALHHGGMQARNVLLRGGLDFGTAILRQASFELPDDGKVSGSGQYAQGVVAGKILMDSPKAQAEARFNGTWPALTVAPLRGRFGSTKFDGQAVFDLGEAQSFAWTGQVGPHPDTRAAGRLRWGGASTSISDLKLGFGPHSAAGQISADFSDPMPRIRGALRAAIIDLDAALPTVAQPAAHSAPAKSKRKSAPAPRGNKTAKQQPGTAAMQDWSDSPLNWPALPAMDVEIELAAEALTTSTWRLTAPQALLHLAENSIRLSRIQAGLYSGLLTGDIQATTGAAPKLAADLQLNKARIGPLKIGMAGVTAASGVLNGAAKLSAAGNSIKAMIAELNGDVQAGATDGTITGIDLAAINAQAAHLSNFGNVLALLQSGLNGGTTRYSKFESAFHIHNGIASATQLTLIAEGAKAGGEMLVDLPRRQLNGRIVAALNALPKAPLGLRIAGNWAKPRFAVDANDLQKALLQGGLGKIMKSDDGVKSDPKRGLKDLFKYFTGK